MFYGGKHADGNTENCLIVFKDSTYIELIGLVKPAALDDPNGMHATLFNLGEGWAGFALLSEDLEHNVTEMQQRGLTLSGHMIIAATSPMVNWSRGVRQRYPLI